MDSTAVTGSKRGRAQLQGVFGRRAHHLEEKSSIQASEKDYEQMHFWVLFVWSRVPFLA
jgi:hypothetical protein